MRSIAYVGMDVHQREIRVAMVDGESGELVSEHVIDNNEDRVRKLMRKLGAGRELRCCYEAGGCGYMVQRWLAAMSIPCAVIAPSLIPRRPGERVKTDRRDARKLASLYRAGELTEVHVPSEKQEAGRGLVRSREILRREVLRSRHYVLKFLQCRGLVYREGKNWTQRHWRYLRGLRFEGPQDVSYRELLALLEFKLEQMKRIEAEVAQLADEEPYRRMVARLRCYRGIDTLTAMVLVSELWDVRRFATAAHLMSYMGLVPQEHSSGSTRRQGSITKTGNGYCRRVLVESAWHYQHKPGVGAGLHKRQEGQPVETIMRSWKAQYRLHDKYWRVLHRADKRTATVAVARELAGFVWAEMRSGLDERRSAHRTQQAA